MLGLESEGLSKKCGCYRALYPIRILYYSRKAQCGLRIVDKDFEKERNLIDGIELSRLKGFGKLFHACKACEQRYG